MRRSVIFASLAMIMLTGCFWAGFAQDDRLDGPWRLIAVDTVGQLSLNRCANGCSSVITPASTVYAAGWNKSYVVVAGHPSKNPFGEFDRSIRQFFYVARPMNEAEMGANIVVSGPFDADQFEAEKKRLSLPEFSKHILENE